ncbi:MAG: hypothetical protein HQ518_07350 [Rhodopirellula sp.]|nr:hypothetical protein [Rhodopirellula sp.]
MSTPRFSTEFVTAFTTEDEKLALKLREILKEADISCQLVRGSFPSGEGDAHDLIEIKVAADDMSTASQLIDANQRIGHFTGLDVLPGVSAPRVQPLPLATSPLSMVAPAKAR